MIVVLLAVAAAAVLVVGVVLSQIAFAYVALGLAVLGLALLSARVVRRHRGADDSSEAKEVVAEQEPFEMETDEDEDEDETVVEAITVLVTNGRRRFHRPGCELATGRAFDEVTVEEAREEGYTACSTCNPATAAS